MGASSLWTAHRRKLRGRPTIPSRSGQWRRPALRPSRRLRSSANLRRCLGVDAKRLPPLPRIPGCSRRARRIQRQIHVQPDGASRRFLRHFAKSHSRHLPEFLSTGETLAVHRHPARPRSGMSGATGRVTVLDLEPVNADFLAEVLAGLSGRPRSLPCKFFYDERGADFFLKICGLPEYYITRTETELLRRYGREMAESI